MIVPLWLAACGGTAARPTVVASRAASATAAASGPYIYWANWGAGRGTTIGRANLDGTAVNPSFITGA
ncbi:MAG TPA: hypothetical protein VN973_10145, partial [Candidatus Dormibacteraeota bacterium]|nr:hypothetical protein [Candidatus Dormibacteraeota bacterium]